MKTHFSINQIFINFYLKKLEKNNFTSRISPSSVMWVTIVWTKSSNQSISLVRSCHCFSCKGTLVMWVLYTQHGNCSSQIADQSTAKRSSMGPNSSNMKKCAILYFRLKTNKPITIHQKLDRATLFVSRKTKIMSLAI